MTQPPLIQLIGARVSRGGRPILADVSFSLFAGRHLALIGENGAGKSVFLRLLKGDIWPDQDLSRQAPARLYALDGAPGESPIRAKGLITLTSQEQWDFYHNAAPGLTAFEAAASGFFDAPLAYAPPTPAQEAAITALFDELALTRLAARDMARLSHGQGMRVLLARALAPGPRVLILDEALSGLDKTSRQAMQAILARLAVSGPTIVMASHRPREIPAFIDNALWLKDGRVAMEGPREAVAAAFAKRARARLAAPAAASPTPPDRAGSPVQDHLVSIKNASVSISGKTVLHDISWTVAPGENWAVLGANGAGKSTLLRLVHGDLYPHAGGGVSRFPALTPKGIWEIRAKTGFVSREFQADYRTQTTALEAVASGFHGSLGVYQEITSAQLQKARAVIKRLGAENLDNQRMDSLSTGQARKILICRALVHDPALLLLDEPLSGLDNASRREILATLDSAAAQGTQIIISTHHHDDLPGCITRGLTLEEGRIVRME